MSSIAVELRGVSVVLGRQLVLDDIHMRVPAGDYVALIGPNGGGKTTLLRVILGLIQPQSGEVRVLGVTPEEARGRVSYVPQYARFDLGFPIRVVDVVQSGQLGAQGLRRNEARAKALRVLEQLEIGDLAGQAIGALSGGQLQRVLIARALAVEPEVLVLDEPTASLDVQSADAFYELLRRLSERMTVLLTSHDVTGISTRVKSIACLNRRLFFHPSGEVTSEMLAEVYGCDVDLVAHGVPHRVLREHDG